MTRARENAKSLLDINGEAFKTRGAWESAQLTLYLNDFTHTFGFDQSTTSPPRMHWSFWKHTCAVEYERYDLERCKERGGHILPARSDVSAALILASGVTFSAIRSPTITISTYYFYSSNGKRASSSSFEPCSMPPECPNVPEGLE